MYCWGNNYYAQIGDGSYGNVRTATHIPNLTVTSAAAGWDASCGITISSGVYCWGDRTVPQISAYVPAPVPPSNTATAVSVGNWHRCFVTPSGASCWGDNLSGQLGSGTVGPYEAAPIPVQGGGRFVSVAAGFVTTCGLTGLGEAYCWGLNAYGDVGDGTTTLRAAPTRVLDPIT
jgi:serine/threonine-protein kinase